MKNKPYPLYDWPSFSTLWELLSYLADKYEERQAFRIPVRGKQEDEYKTYREFYNDTEALGAWLLNSGVRNDRVAILGENCYNWIVSYFAIANSGNTALPLDKELSCEELARLINLCGCKGVVCSAAYDDYAEYFEENCPDIEVFVVMNELGKHIREGAELIKNGTDLLSGSRPAANNLAAIVFTSGTTGQSKGVMLSHMNISSDALSVCRNTCASGRGILILPLHHTFSLTTNVLCELIYGMRIYAITSLRTIQRDMQKDKTTTAIVVPAVVETMHKRVMENVEENGKLKKLVKGMKTAEMFLKIGIDVRKKLFKDVINAFGGELEIIICGGAALSNKVEEDFRLWGVNMVCGYGITECSPVACVNRNEYQKSGSIGLPVDCNEVKINDPDKDGVGEIYVKGSNVFKGYYKNEEENQKAFTADGWFKTGDLGYIDNDGFVFIGGRLKNLIILSNGKNVSPEELETKLIDEIPSISEVVVYEEDAALTAEIFPDSEKYRNAADIMQEEINSFNRHMPAYKKITNIKLRDREFDKTTTMKIKRRYNNRKDDKNA